MIHTQFWPEDLDYANKKVAVIGSGATAITLVPAMATKAKKVTMIQRSPGYIVAVANRAQPTPLWQYIIPTFLKRKLTRYMYVLTGFILKMFLNRDTSWMIPRLKKNTASQLPESIPMDPHFNPSYKPFTQRIGICPNGDFFEALRNGTADIATGIIENVTENSVILKSGQEIEADIIITATVSVIISEHEKWG